MAFIVTWMDLEIIALSEVSQKERQISQICDIPYMWNIKYDTKELICETFRIRLTNIENRSVVAKGEAGIEEGRTRGLELADLNYYIEDGKSTRSFCISQGAVFSTLW